MKKAIIGVIAAIVLLAGMSVLFDFQGMGGKDITVFIPQGSGASEIVRILKDKKVITYKALFLRYIASDAAHLTAGIHQMKTAMGYKAALTELKNDVPLTEQTKIIIPEGYEQREIAALLEHSDITTAEAFQSACKEAHNRYDFLPADGNTEGYLFPATYEFDKGIDATAVVDKMVDAFRSNVLTEPRLARAAELQLSLHQTITLASVIEREAALSSERSTVSSVFHNRLKSNMRLESCATVQYILAERKPVLSTADTKIDSPYNTYLHIGLPPAPIASPGIASIDAALYPADTEYLFFVADGSGGHKFSRTYQEHLAAQGG